MKKIGIITSSCGKSGTYGCNYGAALQGYALVRQLRDWGYDAYDINYLSSYEYRPQQYSKLKRTLLRLRILLDPMAVKGKIAQIKNRNKLKLNFSCFEEFVKKNNLTYQNGKFYTLVELNNVSDSFYAFITGSDVVWNPYLHKNVNDPGYFLDFAKLGVKRISYAASFGVTTLPKESRKTLKNFLDKFDSISVREKSGAKLIKDVTDIDVSVVLDPTFLLDAQKYNDIESKVIDLPEKYIAVYKFGKISHTEEKIKEISRKLNWPVIYIPSGETVIYNVKYDIGPGEFIYIIRNAGLVISDSFHCTVFCLINHTNFLAFYRTLPQEGRDLNARVIDLLDMVKLSDRIIKPNEEINYDKLLQIDFSSSDKIIEKMRNKSLEYLKNALEK